MGFKESASELHELSATALQGLLSGGEITPTDVAEHYLGRIESSPDLGAFVLVTPDEARQSCANLEAMSPERRPPLWGIPQADKDLANRKGLPTLYGSAAVQAFLADHPEVVASQPSDPIVKLADEIGLVSLGKTNTPEFGLYGYTESQVAPPALHPLDPSFGAGGSSGGAATAVAAGLLPWAIGSDGGGSVRIPAATVGLVGLKPTLGVIRGDRTEPEAGGVVNGPLARSSEDTALLFEAMAGKAPGSITETLDLKIGPLRLGYATDSPWNPTYEFSEDPYGLEALDAGLNQLARLGHQVVGTLSLADRQYGNIFLRSWQLAAANIPEWLDVALMNPVTQWLIEAGRSFTDEQKAKNQADKAAFAVRCARRLQDVDVLVTPALGLPPQLVGWHSEIPEENFRDQCAYSPYTSFVNVLGWPAITVPVTWLPYGDSGQTLPFGIQLVGKPGDDALLLQLAHQLEGVCEQK